MKKQHEDAIKHGTVPSFVTIIKPVVATSRRPTVNKRGFGIPGCNLFCEVRAYISVDN